MKNNECIEEGDLSGTGARPVLIFTIFAVDGTDQGQKQNNKNSNKEKKKK